MGADIYLDWNEKTAEDKEKQNTGFRIDAGDVGYLRASMGMVRENSFLRALFPEKYWNNNMGKAIRCKFTEDKYRILIKAGVVYLSCISIGRKAGGNFCHKETGINGKQDIQRDKGFRDRRCGEISEP